MSRLINHRILPIVALAGSLCLFSVPVFAATKYADVNGRATNSGNSRSDPWDAKSCFELLSPGDKCIYLPGNYGATKFVPTKSGSSSSPIRHECETLHGCSFDQIRVENVSYLVVKNIKSDSRYFDPTHSQANPRALVAGAHHISFDSIYVRGEPQRCADSNLTLGCPYGDADNRYNDLFVIGSPSGNSSHNIEITGRTRLLNANHDVVTFRDDGDTTACEANESNIWVHGTEAEPIIVMMPYHHNFSFKGACRVLVEHVDFQQAGNGRGDLQQPMNADNDVQSGGTFHGADYRHVIVRYSTVSKGGSATSEFRNGAHIEVGLFGNRVEGACFAHVSHDKSWGPFATIGKLNSMTSVRNFAIINNAVSNAWHMRTFNSAAVTSPYAEYLMVRVGGDSDFSAYIDGLVGSSTFGTDKLLYNGSGSKTFSQAPFVANGVTVGSNVTRYNGNIYVNANGRDFTPVAGSPLIGKASPISRTTNQGSGTVIGVDRPECFMGTMGGMRSGDVIDVGGRECRVVDANIAKGQVTCASSIGWQQGAPIYYKLNGRIFNDIGAVAYGDSVARPNPPQLFSLGN